MPVRIRSSFVACPVLLFALLFATSLVAQVKVLKNFTLIDGTGHAPLAHAAMILENGRIVMDGVARDLAQNEDVKEFYLGLSSAGRKSFRDVKHYRRRKRWLA